MRSCRFDGKHNSKWLTRRRGTQTEYVNVGECPPFTSIPYPNEAAYPKHNSVGVNGNTFAPMNNSNEMRNALFAPECSLFAARHSTLQSFNIVNIFLKKVSSPCLSYSISSLGGLAGLCVFVPGRNITLLSCLFLFLYLLHKTRLSQVPPKG